MIILKVLKFDGQKELVGTIEKLVLAALQCRWWRVDRQRHLGTFCGWKYEKLVPMKYANAVVTWAAELVETCVCCCCTKLL